MKQIRKRLTYANVMSTIAVFLVVGGGAAIAADSLLPKNSVGSKQLKKKSVKTSKLAKNAVTSPKVKNGSLKAADFAAGQLPAGPQGPQGAPGSAVAYAHVLANGTVDTANSKNIAGANVERVEAGVYCFRNLSFTVHSVTVSPDAYGPADGILVNPTFHGAPPYSGCEEDPRVRTTTVGAPGTPSDHPFYIVFE